MGIYLLINKEIINALNKLSSNEANKEIKKLIQFKKVDNASTSLFEKEDINEIMLSKIFVDFEQNIYRTKLRNFANNEEIIIYIFSYNSILYKNLFKRIEDVHAIKIKNVFSNEFNASKIKARNNKKESVAQKVVKWWLSYNWEKEMEITEILKINGITRKQFNKAKEKNKKFKQFIDNNKGLKLDYYFMNYKSKY